MRTASKSYAMLEVLSASFEIRHITLYQDVVGLFPIDDKTPGELL